MEHKELNKICTILNGYSFKSEKYSDEGYRVIRITNVQKGLIVDDDPKFYSFEDMKDLKRYELFENDLLMSLTGNVGRVGIIDQNMLPAALNQRVACLRLKDKSVNLKYLFYWLNSDKFEKTCISNSNGIAQKNLSTEFLKSVPIPIPPLETQKKIVEALDKAQDLIDARKEQIRLMDELVKSRFVEMFGELSNNNKKWLEVGLENACSVIYRYPTFYGMEYVESGTPVIRIGNILSNGTVDDELRNYVRVYEKVNADFPQTVIQKDDILMAVRGDGSAAKRIGLVKSQKLNGANISPNLLRIRHKEGVANSIFLFWYLTSDVGQKRLDAFVNKTAKKNIAAKDIKILKTPLPPIDLQNLFAEFVHQVEISRSEMQNSLNELITTHQALMQQYFG